MNLTKLQETTALDLNRCANDYLKVGLDLFFERRSSDWQHFQVSLGNLAIGLELFMKSILASKNLALVFEELPLEIQVACSVPNTPVHGAVVHQFELGLRSGTYKTCEFDACLARLLVLFPELRVQLASHLRVVARNRNVSVHGYFPLFQRFDLERIAYSSIRMIQFLSEKKAVVVPYSLIGKRELEYVAKFDSERVERVKVMVDSAKTRARSLTTPGPAISVDGWEEMVMRCPICQNDAVATGDTSYSLEDGEDGAEEILTFDAEDFECQACGLALKDSEEMRLAGVNAQHDRSDELRKWPRDPDWED